MSVNNLSFDPHDPIFEIPGLPGVQWGIQVFTTGNFYSLAPDKVQVAATGNSIHLTCSQLSWGGQQQRSEGRVEVQLHTEDGAFVWTAQAWHHEPIKAIKLMFWGLPESALAKGWWQSTSDQKDVFHPTDSASLLWRYPWPEWLTAWACAGPSCT